jgi:hypothetical protein
MLQQLHHHSVFLTKKDLEEQDNPQAESQVQKAKIAKSKRSLSTVKLIQIHSFFCGSGAKQIISTARFYQASRRTVSLG